MSQDDIPVLVAMRMDQAEEALSVVRFLVGKESGARTAVNRAYYAAYYAVLALLQTVGEIPKKHKGAISSFDRLFVRTNLLPKETTKLLHRLFEARLEDDYERLEPIPMAEAAEALEQAKCFVKAVRNHLAQQGFISKRGN